MNSFASQLEVRSSPIQGRGLFATAALPARRKLGEISGKLVPLPQARQKIANRPRIYLIELTRRFALDCTRGNCFKYLNHSCRPNCYLRVLRRTVEVYTLRPIAAGAELTVDYGLTPHEGGMKCRCGHERCKGVL